MMKITLWSILSGQLSGHLVLNVPETQTLRQLLETYCTHKKVSVSSEYVIRSKDNHILNLSKTLKEASVEEGSTLMIGLLGDEKQTFAFGSWYLITFASFIIGFFGIGCVVWLSLQVLPKQQKFGVVIDAGSTHSEVFVFSWEGDKPLGTGDVKLVHSCFIEGGISDFASHVQDLHEYFEPCLSESADYVPASKIAETPLYLGATAGMRILRKLNCDGAENILMTLQQILDVNSTFEFNSKNVNIMSGSEEGMSGWIAVNYLADNLKQHEETAAVLDVGGASLQVTSEMLEPTTWKTVPIKLFNRIHKVVSKSFLCYGIIEAQRRYSYFLLSGNMTKEKQIPPESFTDPCLAEGLTRQIHSEELRGPCTLTDDSQPLILRSSPINPSILKKMFKSYTKKKAKQVTANEQYSEKDINISKSQNEGNQSTKSFTLHGSSNAAKCEDQVKLLFDRQLCESTFKFGDCMGPHSVPLNNGTLYAFSGIFYHIIDTLGMDPDISLSIFKDVVSALCSMDARTLSTMYPDLEVEITKELCFDGMFVYNLLSVGLGINNSWPNVVFSNEINHVDVVWAHGFMINKTSNLPSEAHSSSLSITVFVLLLCFFSAFIISGILFLHHQLRIKRHSTSYQRSDFVGSNYSFG